MRKRTAIIAISYLSAAVLFLGTFSLVQTKRLNRARLAEQRAQEHALEELYAAVAEMDAALEKSLYASSPGMVVSLCAETQSRAQAAAAALGALPLSAQELEGTATFLSRTGDYAAYLLRKVGSGGSCTEEEMENLRLLSDTAALLAANLTQLRTDVSDGLVSLSAAALEESVLSLSDSMVQMEQEFPEFPTLVYDGPFSDVDPDHTAPLDGAAEITQEEALLIGAGFLGTRPNLVEAAGRTEGETPVWRVTAGNYTAHVSVHGGHALRILSDRQASRTILTTEDALEFAREHLSGRGYRSMTESYYMVEDNILTVTFCYESDGVLYYPDMVKISVFMDNGELAGLDAESYVRAHGPRELPAVSVSAEDAQTHVSPALTVLSRRLAVIPSAGGAELLCHEFICENSDGRHYLVYVNAASGQQEKILILLEDETGTLAI